MPEPKTGAPQLLFNAADEMGLSPHWIVANNLFAISVDGREEYVNSARSPLNSAVSVSLAKNKYFTRMILERHNVRNIPFMHPQSIKMAEDFLQKYGEIIVKPIDGSGAQDIRIVTMPLQLKKLEIRDYILEKYIRGKEVRYLVLNNVILAVHESEYGSSVAADRPLRRISYPQATWDDDLSAESLRIANALQLRFAAVDFIIDSKGRHYLLEVNTTPGLKWFHAPTSGPIVNVARHLLEALYESNPNPDNAMIIPELRLMR
jgi:glutathione synthase/RimK-type ligase-like ATP-grasp enzyme